MNVSSEQCDQVEELNKIVHMILTMSETSKEIIKSFETMLITSYNPKLSYDGKFWYVRIEKGYWQKAIGNPYIEGLIENAVKSMKNHVGEILVNEDVNSLIERRDEIHLLTKNLSKWLIKFGQDATKSRLIKHSMSKYPSRRFNQTNHLLFANGTLEIGTNTLNQPDYNQYLTVMIDYPLVLPTTTDTINETFGKLIQLLTNVFSGKQYICNCITEGKSTHTLLDWLGMLLGKYVAFIQSTDIIERPKKKMLNRILDQKKLVVIMNDNDSIWTPNFIKLLNLRRDTLVWCFVSEHTTEFGGESPAASLQIDYHVIDYDVPDPQKLMGLAYQFFLQASSIC